MSYLELSQGKKAIVDDADFEMLSKFKWTYTTYGYAEAYLGGGRKNKTRAFLHRYIMKTPTGMQTDHINGDKLDNRRSNLRICTNKQNSYNTGTRRKIRNELVGVQLLPSGRYRARIRPDKKSHHLGVFDTIEAAALAYNTAAKKYYGEFARLNEVKL